MQFTTLNNEVIWRGNHGSFPHLLSGRCCTTEDLSPYSSFARTNFLRPTLEKHASLNKGWWVVLRNTLSCVAKQDLNHSCHEGSIINEIKKLWNLALLNSATAPIIVAQILLNLPCQVFSNIIFVIFWAPYMYYMNNKFKLNIFLFYIN